MRFAEPVEQDAVFRDPVQDSICSDHGCIDGTREDQYAHYDYENMKKKPENLRSGEIHREPADKVIHIPLANVVRDNHYREKRDEPSGNNCVKANNIRRKLKVLQFR
jgi:hypothetical protein